MGEDELFFRLLATRYNPERETEALTLLEECPELAGREWTGPDEGGRPFVRGSTALHYAANDGKLRLINRLVDLGGDINASNAAWYRSVLSWAANNARVEAIRLLLGRGADPRSLDAVHAAAWGGSGRGKGREEEYVAALRLLVEAGADPHDRRNSSRRSPLETAKKSGNGGAIRFLESLEAG